MKLRSRIRYPGGKGMTQGCQIGIHHRKQTPKNQVRQQGLLVLGFRGRRKKSY